jgi:hypothetical protein
VWSDEPEKQPKNDKSSLYRNNIFSAKNMMNDVYQEDKIRMEEKKYHHFDEKFTINDDDRNVQINSIVVS